jgi:hypothetical protein
MSSRNMRLLPWAALRSDSEHVLLTVHHTDYQAYSTSYSSLCTTLTTRDTVVPTPHCTPNLTPGVQQYLLLTVHHVDCQALVVFTVH